MLIMLVEGCFTEGGLKYLLRLFSEKLYSLEGFEKSRVDEFVCVSFHKILGHK